jgi:hypothetical protein
MPYLARSVPQALDLVDAGVQDVYHSPNVFINYVAAALWESPQLGNSVLTSLNIPVPAPIANYAPNPEQINNYVASAAYAAANPGTPIIAVQGGTSPPGTSEAQAQGNPPGSNTSDPNDLAGNPEVIPPSVTPPSGGGGSWGALENYLQQCIEESKSGKWHRTFQEPGNPNILNCYAHSGGIDNAKKIASKQKDGIPPADKCPWCAAFASTILQAIGVPSLKSLSADAYSAEYAKVPGVQSISLSDPSQWRRNDIIVMNMENGHHVCFIRGVDLSNQTILAAGGNQGNDMKESLFPGYLPRIKSVNRAWTVPPEADKPIIGKLSAPQGGAPKTR